MKRLGADLKSPMWIYAKAFMFLMIALIAEALIVWETRSLRIAVLLGLAIWACCRLYYFCFYVIENYVDREFKFASMTQFLIYLVQGRKTEADSESVDKGD